MSHLKLNVYSPERRLFEATEVQEVVLPSAEGQIEVLPGHAKMIGTLGSGPFSFRRADGAPVSGALSEGFFEVRDDEVSLMAEVIELRDEIDVERARRAQHEAEQALSGPDLTEETVKEHQLKLQRALARQQAAGRAEPAQ